jgi:hypothetical protein
MVPGASLGTSIKAITYKLYTWLTHRLEKALRDLTGKEDLKT